MAVPMSTKAASTLILLRIFAPLMNNYWPHILASAGKFGFDTFCHLLVGHIHVECCMAAAKHLQQLSSRHKSSDCMAERSIITCCQCS